MTSIWNTAHNVGGAGLGFLAVWALDNFASDKSDWTPAFSIPGYVALAISF